MRAEASLQCQEKKTRKLIMRNFFRVYNQRTDGILTDLDTTGPLLLGPKLKTWMVWVFATMQKKPSAQRGT